MATTEEILNEAGKALEKMVLADSITIAQTVASQYNDYLDNLQKSGTIIKGESSVIEVVRTWSSLYPKLFDRSLAWLAYRLGCATDSTTQHWYHTVVPYKIEYGGSFYSPVSDAVEIIPYKATLELPGRKFLVTMSIQPRQPANTITINVSVNKEFNPSEVNDR